MTSNNLFQTKEMVRRNFVSNFVHMKFLYDYYILQLCSRCISIALYIFFIFLQTHEIEFFEFCKQRLHKQYMALNLGGYDDVNLPNLP